MIRAPRITETATAPRPVRENLPGPHVQIPLHIRYLHSLYDNAKLAALEAGESATAAHYAGRRAFRAELPFLDSRSHIQCFIACVAVGFATEMLDGDDAKTLLYNAQMALATLAGAK